MKTWEEAPRLLTASITVGVEGGVYQDQLFSQS